MINLKCIATIFGKANSTCSLVSDFYHLKYCITYKDFCNKISKNFPKISLTFFQC